MIIDPKTDYSSYVAHFADVGDICPDYTNAVGFLVEKGILNNISGGSANVFMPDEPVNRGQVSVVDATEILLYAAGLKPLTWWQLLAADMRSVIPDGKNISAADAVEILLVVAGLKEPPKTP